MPEGRQWYNYLPIFNIPYLDVVNPLRAYPSPACLHATSASRGPHSIPQIPFHSPSANTSTLPKRLCGPPVTRIWKKKCVIEFYKVLSFVIYKFNTTTVIHCNVITFWCSSTSGKWHFTPASSTCPQSPTLHPRWLQLCTECSVPLQSTSSNQIYEIEKYITRREKKWYLYIKLPHLCDAYFKERYSSWVIPKIFRIETLTIADPCFMSHSWEWFYCIFINVQISLIVDGRYNWLNWNWCHISFCYDVVCWF